MLCTPVYIYIQHLSSFRAPTLWFINRIVATTIFNTLFQVYANFFHKKMDKTGKYTKSTISYDMKMVADGY